MMRLDTNTLAGRIQQERTRHGWTQEDLALRAHTSRATIARIEAGKAGPMTFETIQDVLDAIGWQLDITPGLIQGYSDNPPSGEELYKLWLKRRGRL